MKDKQLRLLPDSSKEELKRMVAVIAKRWPPYHERYDEAEFFASIDEGKLTTEEEINGIFRYWRQMML